ncbi:unnamed protein product [Urochloa decumbens]|uniref:Glycosyltransferase 61 catalytic domain-containing protein n=1 Tax=Urochloa decumbens TaxID=240449 RepID=A0ABC8Z9C0_9POAL
MAALGRGAAAAGKAGGGDRRPVGSRVLFVAVGCFLFFLVFLLSSRPDVAVVLDAPAGGVRLHQGQGQGQGGRHGHLQQSAEQSSDDMAITERLTVAVIGGERNDGEDVGRNAAAEEAERESNAFAAVTPNSDEQAQTAAEDPDQDKSMPAAAATARPAVQTTPPPHGLPGDITFTTRADSVEQQPLCDTSGSRADVCDLAGDVRMHANASAFVVVGGAADGQTYKVRPYPRKGDRTSMGRVTEITVRAAAASGAGSPPPPRCTATHAEPAVVFSIGGYAGNLFHDFTDILVPLYAAAARYGGGARLVVADASPRWLARYGAVLRGLSPSPPLDLAAAAAAGEVHCFRRGVVGLRARRELMVEPAERGSPDDRVAAGMPEFTRFLRRALSLPRDAPTRPAAGDDVRKPRLLIVSRRGTRLLLNADAVARVAEEVGFEATVSELSAVAAAAGDDGVERVARLVNSFDAMVGVHGADLTNMVFLPAGAAVVQIVPWGGLRWIARVDFGDPAEAMGLGYIQYEVAVHESTLKDKYPRDHEIFTNPTALHRKGFTFMRNTFLKGQDIVVDVDRFRKVLVQALENLKQ